MIRVGTEKLPKDQWGAATIRQWSALKAHFKVAYREIPQSEFSEAISIVARFQADWELVEAPKPERRQLLVERNRVTTVIDASDKSLIRTDLVDALRRDIAAMEAANKELRHRMRICFGEIDVDDLGQRMHVELDGTSFAAPARRHAA